MSTTDLTIVPIQTPTPGDRSYLVHDGEVAFVVDPQRVIDRVLNLLEEHRVRLTDVFETHIRNDYVTGGLALAEHTGAAYQVNQDDRVSLDRTPITDGQTVEVGARMRVTALATPGHTFTHFSYALTDAGNTDEAGLGHSVGVFSGGSLLYGATGRPNLLGPEKKTNPALTQDEEAYVHELLDDLGDWPTYYAHMAPANSAGPSEPDLGPPALAAASELCRRIEAGEWVVDLRNRTAFAAGHTPGTLNFGLDGAFATYLGWLITCGTPITLLGETPEAVTEAQRELVRIGIDRPSARATGSPQDWTDGELASFETATFADLAHVRHHRDVVILDVRRIDEYDAAAIKDALNIPLHELWSRVNEVPTGEVWVHSAGGHRASVAASMLDASGRPIVAVDDTFDNAEKVGLHVVGTKACPSSWSSA